MSITIYECWETIRKRKRFLHYLSTKNSEIDIKTEPTFYGLIMDNFLGEDNRLRYFPKDIAPKFRIAQTGRMYPQCAFIQRNGRFIKSVSIHNVNLFVSVDSKEFVRFLLMTEGVHLWNFRWIILDFMLGLYYELYHQNSRIRKKDFLLGDCIENEQIRLRVAQALSRYMEFKSKRISRLKNPQKIINEYYGR